MSELHRPYESKFKNIFHIISSLSFSSLVAFYILILWIRVTLVKTAILNADIRRDLTLIDYN
jgi:hypothetical protein